MSEALLRLDRVDEEQQRLLAEARRQVADLHLEATRAKATATEAARKIVAQAEAEAASLLQAARDEASRMSAESEKEAQVIAQSFLTGVRKTRDDTLAAARSEADRLREEAAAGRDAIIEAAYHHATRVLREAEQVADEMRRPCRCAFGVDALTEGEERLTTDTGTGAGEGPEDADNVAPWSTTTKTVGAPRDVEPPSYDDMRALMVKMERALDALVGVVHADPGPAPAPHEAAPLSGPTSPERAAAPTQPSMPFIGSRGQRWSSTSVPVATGATEDPPVVDRERRPVATSHPRANGTGGVRPVPRRRWRSRDQ